MTVWLLSTCALIAALLLLRRALRGRIDPRLVYALWLLAAVRVLVPVSLFDLPVSVSGLMEQAGVTQAVEDARYTTQTEETYGSKSSGQTDVEAINGLEDMDWVQRESWLGSRNITGVEVVDAQEVPAEEAGGDPDSGSTYVRLELEVTRDRFAVLRYIWYVGIALVAVWFLFVNLRFSRRLRKQGVPYTEALPLDCPLPVYVVDGLSTPCLAGLFRPAIYLNRAALNSGHLDHILTHELVHYRHRDHWWAVVRCACLAVQWFDPLVWVAAYLSRQDCETACDASAIKRLGEGERLSYGHTLVNMIAAGRHPSALFQTATTMTGSLNSIRYRVTLIAKKPRMTALTLAAALVVTILAAGCTLGGPGEPDSLPRAWYGTYVLDGERGGAGDGIVAPSFISYSPTADSIGPILISADTCAYQREGGDFDPAAQDPGYQAVELDLSAYGDADIYYPALDDFFGGYESIQAYEVANAACPTQLLVLDGELWIVLNAQENGAFFCRLAEGDGTFDFSQLYELPDDLADDVTVVIGERDDSDPHFRASVNYYYTADYDPEDLSFGRLLGVQQVTPGGFERYFFADGIYERPGWDGTYYYHITGPSDMQCSLENMEDYEQVSTRLREWLMSVFENDEDIQPVNVSDTPFVDDFSYSGNHIDATITPVGSEEVICTLVLSQPVTQGAGGIWCVERIYYPGESEPQYIIPQNDEYSAAEYYALLQAQADAGEAFSCATAGYDEGNTAVNFVYEWLGLDSAEIGYSEMYSADKGASRDDTGPAITGTDAAMQAQELYDAIVGMGRLSTFQKDFYLEVDDGGEVTRLAITQDNGYNVDHSGDFMLHFTWETSFVGLSPSGISVTVESADGDSWIECWEDSNLVLLHQDGEDIWMTATPQSDTQYTLYRSLIGAASDVMTDQMTYGITMDGALTDYQQVAEQYLEQLAAAWRAAPDWMPSKPEDAQPGSATVSQAYWGEGENFCTSTLLYIQIDPMGEGAGYWQAGSGLSELEEGPYNTANGYYAYYLGRDFARNENGDWVCTGGYTGGEMVTLPTPVEEATVEQLVDYFYHTSGFAHEYFIPMELSRRPVSELNAALDGADDPQKLCAALGHFFWEYSWSDEGLTYEVLLDGLDDQYAAWMEASYEGESLSRTELDELDQWLGQSGNCEMFWYGADDMDEADLALLLHDGADVGDVEQDLPQEDKDLLAQIGVDADLQLSEGVAVKVTGDQIKDYAWRRLGLDLTDEDLQERVVEQSKHNGWGEWYYTSQNDTFYRFGNGTSRIDVGCLSGVAYSDGSLALTVEANYSGGPQYVATLTPYGDSYRFVSVVPVL